MSTNEILIDAYTRIQEQVHKTLKDLDETQLAKRPSPEANSIAWLIWHLTRVQDSQISELAGTVQRYTASNWSKKFDLPFDDTETGYGQTSEQAGQVQADADTLKDYYDAVHTDTITYLKNLTDEDYGRIVDRRWNPPVTLAARLVSILSDDLQHVGQAAYVRGLLL